MIYTDCAYVSYNSRLKSSELIKIYIFRLDACIFRLNMSDDEISIPCNIKLDHVAYIGMHVVNSSKMMN